MKAEFFLSDFGKTVKVSLLILLEKFVNFIFCTRYSFTNKLFSYFYSNF